MLSPGFLASCLQICRMVHLCCFSHPLCGNLLWQLIHSFADISVSSTPFRGAPLSLVHPLPDSPLQVISSFIPTGRLVSSQGFISNCVCATNLPFVPKRYRCFCNSVSRSGFFFRLLFMLVSLVWAVDVSRPRWLRGKTQCQESNRKYKEQNPLINILVTTPCNLYIDTDLSFQLPQKGPCIPVPSVPLTSERKYKTGKEENSKLRNHPSWKDVEVFRKQCY